MSRLILASDKLRSILSSNRFFYVAIIIFGVATAWMATASLYPMAFDEEFHYGLLKIYATNLIPYGIEHTTDMAQYGAATGDPSYLFHYLMSWPYRVLDLLGLPDMAIIIALRFINLGLVIGSFFVFRKAFLKAGFSVLLTNMSLVIFLFVPALSMLAAQINYDSLLMLVVAMCLLLTITITKHALRHGKLLAKETLWLAIMVLIGMPIKYAFLPIAAAFFIWMVILVGIVWKRFNQPLLAQIKSFIAACGHLSKSTKVWLSIAGILGIFFAAHYVTNYVQYGSPMPSCDAVFDKQACKAYGPWNRDQNYAKNLSPSFVPISLPVYLVQEWVPGMTIRLTFALAGKTNNFQTMKPPLLVITGFSVLTLVGFILLAWRFIRYRSTIGYFVWLTLLLCALYCGVLIAQLYLGYVRTGQPIAINGRYLLPLLPMLGLVMMESAAVIFHNTSRHVKVAIVSAILLFFIFTGAGATTYIVLSESHWFWPGWGQASQAVLQPILDALTFEIRY